MKSAPDILLKNKVLGGPVGQQVLDLVTGCQLCEGSTPTSDILMNTMLRDSTCFLYKF